VKILIIGFSNINYMPYLNFYLSNIDTRINDVDVIYWDREGNCNGENLKDSVNYHPFTKVISDQIPKYKKIVSFIRFKAYCYKYLRNNKVDYIVLLHTSPAVLLRRILFKKFKYKYIFDFRDITYEKYWLYRKTVEKIIRFSEQTFLSSERFKSIFSSEVQDKFVVTHNVNINVIECVNIPNYNRKDKKIKITFWGFLREQKTNELLINAFSSDNRFELHYYGKIQSIALALMKYVEVRRIDNVFFHGKYKPKDIPLIVSNSDLVHNVYSGSAMKLAMSNKFYEAIAYFRPQICLEGTFMADMVMRYSCGFALNILSENLAEEVYNYFTSISANEFSTNCRTALSLIRAEYDSSCNVVKKILNKRGRANSANE